MIWVISKMILGLGLVFLFLFIIAKFLKRTSLLGVDSACAQLVRPLAARPIAPRKYIALVEICGDIYALGVSESQISLITKIDKKDYIERMNTPQEIQQSSFSLLQEISKGTRRLKNGSLRISQRFR